METIARGRSAAQIAEDEDNIRLRKSEEALEYCRQKENAARRALNDAIAASRRAKEQYETLFLECEERACARRRAGLIDVTAGY